MIIKDIQRTSPHQFKISFAKQGVKIAVLWSMKKIGLFTSVNLRKKNCLPIIFYHGVSLSDEHTVFKCLFISKERLTRRLQYLRKSSWRVVSLEEGLKYLAEGYVPYRTIVLTFDDGFYNFYAAAAPILQEYGMTATNYINSYYIDHQMPVFDIAAEYVIYKSSLDKVLFNIPGLKAGIPIRSDKDKAFLWSMVKKYVLAEGLSAEEKHEYTYKLAETVGVDYNKICFSRLFHLMTWSQVQELSKKGFDFQLHTHRHRNVVDYFDEIEEEISINRKKIEAVTGKPAVHFAYPSGRWNREVWPVMKRVSIRSAVTTMVHLNMPTTPILGLGRFQDGEGFHELEFEYRITGLSDFIHHYLW